MASVAAAAVEQGHGRAGDLDLVAQRALPDHAQIADLLQRRGFGAGGGHGEGVAAPPVALNGAGQRQVPGRRRPFHAAVQPLADRSVNSLPTERSIRLWTKPMAPPITRRTGVENRCFTTRMRCSARCSPGPARSPISARAGCRIRSIPSPIRTWGRSSHRPSTFSPMPAAPRGKPEFGLESTIVDGRTVAVHEEIVLRKPFGQLKRFRREGVEDRPEAADRRADVGPLCDPAARHGRADAARPRRLHHRLARREAGAAERRAASTSTIISTI